MPRSSRENDRCLVCLGDPFYDRDNRSLRGKGRFVADLTKNKMETRQKTPFSLIKKEVLEVVI
jgi:hypothetical protein